MNIDNAKAKIVSPVPGISNMTLFRQQCLINGDWVSGASSLVVYNPATGHALGAVPCLGFSETEKAIDAAHQAFQAWKATPAKDRAACLRRWYEAIMENADDLARLLTAEQGKPLAEAKGEILYAASYVGWFAEEAERIYGSTIPGQTTTRRQMVIKQPVGVVAAITPWNFPAAMITRKLAPAFAAGCTVVLKPSELTPFSALALATLAVDAGFPRGVLNVVTGAPVPIGDALTGDPRVRKFTFTGSTRVGTELAARCMRSAKRVSLELGGNAPFIVFADADLDAAVEGALVAKFRNTGQTCVCANRIYVQKNIYASFAARLVDRVRSLKIGDGLAGETQQGPLINEAALKKVQDHVEDALQKGATLLTGGKVIKSGTTFYSPAVLTGVVQDMLICREETFGPVAGLIEFDNEEEVVRMANDTEAGLASYLFTRDYARATRVSEELNFGMIGLNTGAFSSAVIPFGGIKMSGFGREGSSYGMEDYLDIKVVCSEIAPA